MNPGIFAGVARRNSGIKSIQRGVFTSATASMNGTTATLSPAVDTSKSVITCLGANTVVSSGTNGLSDGRVVLTNGTTVTGYGATTATGTFTLSVGYQVVEYY